MIKINLLPKNPEPWKSMKQYECDHEWTIQPGFLESYEHCQKCGLDKKLNKVTHYPGEYNKK